MPKVASPVVLKETDVIQIDSIISGQTLAGPDVQRRAKVLRLLSEGRRVKDVAEAVEMRENSVTDIRRRFEERGMESLLDMKRSGRPVDIDAKADVEIKIKEILDKAREAGENLPNVKTIAASINASEYAVRDAMEKMGLIKERSRTWDFKTEDGTGTALVDVAGIYLSSSQQLIAVKVQKDPLVLIENDGAEGVLCVRDRTLALALTAKADSNGCIQLAQALELYSRDNGMKQGRSGNALAFIQSLQDGTPDPRFEIHVFACGAPLVDNGRTLINHAILHQIEDQGQWMDQAECLISMFCRSGAGYETVIAICNGMEAYLRNASNQTACFEWKKLMAPILDSNDVSQDGPDPVVKPGTLECTMRIMGDDGQWITCVSTGTMQVTQEGFDTASTAGYLGSFHKVEQAIADISHQTAKAINEKYAAELAKKTLGTMTSTS